MLEEPQHPEEALRLLKSMTRFRNSRETREILEWLKSELTRMDVENRSETVDLAFKQRQGALQLLAKLLEMVEGARDRCDEIERDVKSANLPLHERCPNFQKGDSRHAQFSF